MATEIERKFLVVSDDWRACVQRSQPMRQGYLSGGRKGSIRVRIAGYRAWLNIKSATLGVRRLEFEYAIPLQDAAEMLERLCDGPLVEKVRHEVPLGDHLWEVDEFQGENAGLIVAEVELADEDETFTMPSWAGEEVSNDPRYYNVSLVKSPYSTW
ncbi:MAG: CYTH domain-containing protein [Ectothiorhodospiraceae bacterium]|nr:CYTH domain-containing protein [Ectothiorhodospiraceae bacterium]